MPEIVEVEIISEYINKVCKNKYFTSINKSSVSKNPNIKISFEKFKIKSEARGKELKLTLYQGREKMSIFFTMGMTGYFKLMKKDNIEKHTHLLFERNGDVLGFIDSRRFGTWRVGYTWSNTKGLPIDNEEYGMDLYLKYLNCSINHKKCLKIFEQPIFKLMLNQKYFNGIGNYLRAEILYRTDINPFLPAKSVLSEHFFKTMKKVITESYNLGGGQLMSWKNPFGADANKFKAWIQCYGKQDKITEGGRTFWFNPKYRQYYEDMKGLN